MPVVVLTKRAVDAAQPSAREWCLWDTEVKGFGLRVRPSGVKTYVACYCAGEGRKAQVQVTRAEQRRAHACLLHRVAALPIAKGSGTRFAR